MKFAKINKANTYILRIETGEEIYKAIEEFCIKHKTKFAQFSGIGAVENFEYGIYEDGKYTKFREEKLSELISLIGNISLMDNKYVIHSHATFSNLTNDKKVHTFSGHLFNAICGVTVEITLHTYQEAFEKRYSPKAGLNVLDLDESLKE